MAFSNERFEPSRALGIGAVAAARSNRLNRRRAERMALLRAAQRAGGEHPDVDDSHIGGFRMRQQIAVIMRRVTSGDSRAGARIEEIVADLRGVDDAGVDDLVERGGVADGRDAVEAGLPLLAQTLERRHDLAEHGLWRQVAVAAIPGDMVVELEQVDLVELEPL